MVEQYILISHCKDCFPSIPPNHMCNFVGFVDMNLPARPTKLEALNKNTLWHGLGTPSDTSIQT